MKRLTSCLGIALAALAALAAGPAALAGTDIMKCVDAAGRVTLTDQPCEGNARATRMVAASALNVPTDTMSGSSGGAATGSGGGTDSEATENEGVSVAVQRYAAPPAMLGQHDWRAQVPQRSRPLARDVATLKAARAQLLLIDSERQPRPHLATLQ